MTDIKETRTLTLEGALKVLNAAIAEATRIGQPMCIAVVDTGGNLLAFGRMDGSKGLSDLVHQQGADVGAVGLADRRRSRGRGNPGHPRA